MSSRSSRRRSSANTPSSSEPAQTPHTHTSSHSTIPSALPPDTPDTAVGAVLSAPTDPPLRLFHLRQRCATIRNDDFRFTSKAAKLNTITEDQRPVARRLTTVDSDPHFDDDVRKGSASS